MEDLFSFDFNFNTDTLWSWLEKVLPLLEVALIIVAAVLLKNFSKKLLHRLETRYHLSGQWVTVTYRFLGAFIYISAFFLVLDRFGVSGSVLWGAFTGFAAVAAVAFFAAWSVLSNIFCTLLIVTTRPFRLYDYIEILENGDKPGLKGQVIDINLIYSTLKERNPEEGMDTVLHVPNSWFFQRTLRRWVGNSTPYNKSKKAEPKIALDFNPNPVGPAKPKPEEKTTKR